MLSKHTDTSRQHSQMTVSTGLLPWLNRCYVMPQTRSLAACAVKATVGWAHHSLSWGPSTLATAFYAAAPLAYASTTSINNPWVSCDKQR